MEPTDDITKEYVEGCGMIYDPELKTPSGGLLPIGQERIRVMSPFEIKQRAELNVTNTSEALRARVLAETSKSNGHREGAYELEERCVARSEAGYRCTLKIGHSGAHLSPNDYEF